ncbi:MAG: autotransporter-associated beta strand repeat-containing protein, partial [Planctomycetota bacterium]|nr:autotransporter-associated beta strand repeat-containing protein [Planctomycetota bacterium]
TRTLVPLYQLSILNGGELSAANVQIGEISPAAVLVSGADSCLSVSGSLYVGGTASGPGAAGILTVDSGATVDVGGNAVVWGTGLDHDVHGNPITLGPGTVVLSGGTLNVTGGMTVANGGLLTGFGTLNGDGDVAVAGSVTTNGKMIIGGPGVSPNGNLVLPGVRAVSLYGGTLSAAQGATVAGGGTLTLVGSGTVSGDITLSGGTVGLVGPAGGTTQTLGALILDAKTFSIVGVAQGAGGGATVLAFDRLVRNDGAEVAFGAADAELGTAADGPQVRFTTPPALTGDGLIGLWATVGADFATYGPYGVTVYTDYETGPVDQWNADKNVRIIHDVTVKVDTSVNSLTLNDTSPHVVTISGDPPTLTVAGGYILAANTGQAMEGGTITSGTAALTVYCPFFGTGDPGVQLTIGSVIADNGPQAVSLVKTGNGNLVLAAANTYSGGTKVQEGTLLVENTAGFGTGTGPVTVGAATLGGTGFINGPVTLTGDSTLTSTGTLTINSTLTVQGLANQIAGGTIWTADDVTIDSGAVFIINGTLAGTGSLIVHGTLMGKGTIGKAVSIEAGGVLSPGAPSTIQGMAQILNAQAPRNFSFEIGAANPDYASPSNSLNDLIRLTDTAAPFADATGGSPMALSADTVIDVYFLRSDPAAGKYKAEFFAATDFTDAVAGATYQYWRLDPRGERLHNGNFFSPLDASLVDWSVVPETATFGGAIASGYITEFAVVPEPATLGLLASGGAALLARRKRRK